MNDYLKGIPMISSMCDKIIQQLDDLRGDEFPDDPDEAELVLWEACISFENAKEQYDLALVKFEAARRNVAEIRIKQLKEKIVARPPVVAEIKEPGVAAPEPTEKGT